MSLFKGIRRVLNEVKDDDNIIKEAAGRQAVFNTRCRFKDFGFYDLNSIPFYHPSARSAIPSGFMVCQECFKASIAPTPLAKSFTREIKSSKDPEQITECAFSRPFNEPAWRASVEQGREAPLVQWLKEVTVLEANLLKCPKEANSISQISVGGRVGFRTLRKNTSFKICEYHFAAVVRGTWMEDEFVHLRNTPSATLCDFGPSEVFATIALALAKRTFNFKTFENWAGAYQSLPVCNGIIEAGNNKYTLPAVQYTSAQRFQVCETCYRLIFAPHAIIQPQFQEIHGAQNSSRGVCTMNGYSAFGYTETLLKATWKRSPSALLEFARDQVPIPPCPGSSSTTRMLWYGSDGVPRFVCCESCFQTTILPSTLYSSFGRFPESDCQMEHCCDMSFSQVRVLFAAACKIGRITAFRSGIDELAAKMQRDNAAEQRAEQDALHPEQDLSQVRGTPEQIQEVEALRDEVQRLQAEAKRLLEKGSAEYGRGLEQMGYGNASALIGVRTSDRVFDGHGTWFDNSTQADASAMQIEGRLKLEEASKLERLVRQKRVLLRDMKEKLTPHP